MAMSHTDRRGVWSWKSGSVNAATIWVSLLCFLGVAHGQPLSAQQVGDIPTRPGVMQRMLVLSPADPKAALIVFAGGHGGLEISPDGAFRWGAGNFLVRSRQMFVDQGFIVAVVDAPSDRPGPTYLAGFRQSAEHVADIKAVIAWLRSHTRLPVWLIGTSRGTQSAAFVATQLRSAEGPDGLVLTSTILADNQGRPVPAMPLETLSITVLVVHHEHDGCRHCSFAGLPKLMAKLGSVPKKQLLVFTGGVNRGDPCEAFAYHGFNGIESDVVSQIGAWILPK